MLLCLRIVLSYLSFQTPKLHFVSDHRAPRKTVRRYALLRTYAPIRDDPKRVAWVHTLATAWLAGPVSLWYMYSYVWHWNEAANFTEDTTSRFVVIYFLCAYSSF